MFTPKWMSILPDNTWAVIQKAAQATWPKSLCGVIVDDQFFQIPNLGRKPNEVIMDPATLRRFNREGGITAVVYSSTDTHPTQEHLQLQIDSGITRILVPMWEGQAQNPIAWGDCCPVEPLTGRQYIYGVNDCYTSVRDFYRTQLDVLLPRVATTLNWWMEGDSEYIKHQDQAGFVRVISPQPYDVVAFKYYLRSDVPVAKQVVNHIAVLLDDNRIYHHMGGAISEYNYLVKDGKPHWKTYAVGYYRHRSLME